MWNPIEKLRKTFGDNTDNTDIPSNADNAESNLQTALAAAHSQDYKGLANSLDQLSWPDSFSDGYGATEHNAIVKRMQQGESNLSEDYEELRAIAMEDPVVDEMMTLFDERFDTFIIDLQNSYIQAEIDVGKQGKIRAYTKPTVESAIPGQSGAECGSTTTVSAPPVRPTDM
jgi:hypothetical protein